MTVWAVIVDYGYEGHCRPAGIFAAREEAEACAAAVREDIGSSPVEVLPYVLGVNHGPHGPEVEA